MNQTTVVTKYNSVPVVYTIDNETQNYELESVGKLSDCRYRFPDFGMLSYTVNVLARADINRELYKSDGSRLYYVAFKGEYNHEY